MKDRDGRVQTRDRLRPTTRLLREEVAVGAGKDLNIV